MSSQVNTFDTKATIVILTSTEWLNLCSRKAIRLSKHRPVRISHPPMEKEMNTAFAKAPFTKLKSSVDVLAITIAPDWASKESRHSASPQDIYWLKLKDVQSHHSIAESDREYYQNITAKSGIVLEESIYEPFWRAWVEGEQNDALLQAWIDLSQVLGLQNPSLTKREDKYKWQEVTHLCRSPKLPLKNKPAHVETLVRNLAFISDAVLGITDSQKFHLAVNIEWIEQRLGKDPLKASQTKKIVSAALEAAEGQDFLPLTDQTLDTLNHLQEKFKKAYTTELNPLVIPQLVSIYLGCKSKSSQLPQKFLGALQFDKSRDSAALLTLMTTCLLGVESAYQLIQLFSYENLMDMTWE